MSQSPPFTESAALELAISCQLAEVRQVAVTARDFLARHGCGPADVMDCELALVEACNNAVEYAGESGREKPVLVEVRCNSGEIELRVTDHTPGFELPEHPVLPDLESESGRGLFLIRSIMDSLEYHRGEGENVMVMRRRRMEPGSAAGNES